MLQYMIGYLGGDQPARPEEGQRHFVKYKEWLASLEVSVLVQMQVQEDR